METERSEIKEAKAEGCARHEGEEASGWIPMDAVCKRCAPSASPTNPASNQ